jgi:hypothetical protein
VNTRRATRADLELVVDLFAGFNEIDRHPYDPARVGALWSRG